jgi:hypothetical protein
VAIVVKVVISYKKDRIGCFTKISILSVSLYSAVDFSSSVAGTCISMGCALLDCTGWMGGWSRGVFLVWEAI